MRKLDAHRKASAPEASAPRESDMCWKCSKKSSVRVLVSLCSPDPEPIPSAPRNQQLQPSWYTYPYCTPLVPVMNAFTRWEESSLFNKRKRLERYWNFRGGRRAREGERWAAGLRLPSGGLLPPLPLQRSFLHSRANAHQTRQRCGSRVPQVPQVLSWIWWR